MPNRGPITRPITVLCVSENALVRKGIASILANEPAMRLVAEAADGGEAVQIYFARRPDVTLMDLPAADGVEAIKTIRRRSPAARIIALTSSEGNPDLCRALEAGAWGYLLKDVAHSELLLAIRIAYASQAQNSPHLPR
jgi:two-component system NarL family response regulator